MTKQSNTRRLTTAVTVLALSSAVAFATPASAASISGKWRGNGVAKLKSGGEERVRCQVTYGRIAGQDFSLTAKCASGAGRLSQNGTLTRVSTNKYVGTVVNKEYSVRASVSVTVSGGKQSVAIVSDKGSAYLQLIRH